MSLELWNHAIIIIVPELKNNLFIWKDSVTIYGWLWTVEGIWINEWIYWPLIHTTWNYKHLQRDR
jgi:hypothetical protein